MMFHEITAGGRRWKSLRETIAALEIQPTAELDDLGIGRWRIRDLAERSAAQ